MSVVALSTIRCPSCDFPIGRHPRFANKRIRELTCKSCGAQIEIILPRYSYHALRIACLLGAELGLLAVVVLLVTGHWMWAVATIVAAVAIEIVRGLFMRRVAEIRWVNQGSMERRASGRWVPE